MRSSLDNDVLTLTFDRPDRLNAVSIADLDAMAEAVENAGRNPQVRVVVIAGEGRSFCSGADIRPTASVWADPGGTIDAANRLTTAIAQVPRPVVARARGVVAGVGVSIALACDLVLCDAESYLLLAFTRVGLMPDGGATALIAASIGRTRALRLALLGEKMTARDALAAGLVSHVWDAEDYENGASAVIEHLLRAPAVALGRTKGAINGATLPHLQKALLTEREGQVHLLAASDFAEGSAALADRRVPRFLDTPESYVGHVPVSGDGGDMTGEAT